MKFLLLAMIIVASVQIGLIENSVASCKNNPPSRAVPKGGCWTGRYEPSERIIYPPWPGKTNIPTRGSRR
jgi:hypothetical protein